MTSRAAVVWIGVSALTFTSAFVAQPPSFLSRGFRLQAEGKQSSSDRIENAYRASNRGVARLEQFDYDAAAEAFREALGIEPTLAAARVNLAIALYYAGQIDAAQKEAQAGAAALPNAPQAPYLLGLIAKGQNKSDEAIAAFKRVLELDREDVGARVNLGQVYLQERNTKEALPLFRDALAREPYNVTAAYGVATTLLRAGEAETGREAMQQFQKLRDSAYGVTYAPGYLQQGRYAEAIVSTGAEPELVSEETPRVTFADATSQAFTARRTDEPLRGALTLFDEDGDGDQDLLTLDGQSLHLYRNDAGRFTDVTASKKLDAIVSGVLSGRARSLGAIAGDYDNDGKIDLFLLTEEGSRLLHQRADGTFEDVTATALGTSTASASRSAAFVDVDHDGDLDIVVAGMSAPGRLLRNNGNGTFTDIASTAGFTSPVAKGLAIVPTDFDNHRDIDLLILNEDRAPVLYQNMRDGTFKDVAPDVGLAPIGAASTIAAGDVNKDSFTDFFVARAGQAPVFALSDGRGKFVLRDAPATAADATAAQFVDYDNDGLLDLLIGTPKGLRLFRNLGTRWADVTGAASLGSATTPVAQMAIADIDGDGDSDVVTRTDKGELRIWRNEGGNRNPAVRVQLAARVSNRSGAGTKVEVRAGALREKLETSAATPAASPADLLFGLGRRATADIVRVLWPSGILQTEIVPAGGAATSAPVLIKVEELDRKPSSCPFLFTWNGARFEFVTDFLGGGEMGDWIAPGVFNQPDPDEYVRIRGDQLRPRDGRYELRITNELEEAMFLDRVQLVAVDHPQGVDVYPNEGLRSPPRQPFRVYATRGAHPPLSAMDEHGHDVLPLIRTVDRKAPDDFGLSHIRGYADRHELTLDLGAAPGRVVLLLTGWTEYAFSNDNVAAEQAGLAMQPPRLEMKDNAGTWRTVIDDLGFPVGRPQTIPVDLTGRFPGVSRQVRIVTNMRIYWDQVLVDTSGETAQPTMTRVNPASATLESRGFSAETSPDDRAPFGYEYSRVTASSPWKVPAGRYTKYGDVQPLLLASDDMFAIAAPGDEVSLAFDAASLPALPRGFTRTFLLYADGFSKEMNIRSATPDALAPLPFHGMRSYPYGAGESYPDTRAHRDYLARYNTRVVTAPVPSLDLSATLAVDPVPRQ
jgi:tetratricopeptide (TPR) repeat protein